MAKALIYIDRQDVKHSVMLLEVIHRLYQEQTEKVSAVSFGELPEMAEGYFDEIHHFKVNDDRLYDMRFMAECVKTVQEEERFDCIVVPATREGRMLAPILAMKLGTGIVADVVEVANEDGEIQMVRPAFDGKIMACIANRDSETAIMTIRPGVFKYQGTPDKATKLIEYVPEKAKEQPIQLLECKEIGVGEDIRDAKVLVSGGGGVIDHFDRLQELADPLKGMVSASRRLVDSGIAPRRIQVGQSGKIVSPKLYIALGIYGSLQHIEGLDNVETIISVNTNKNAPICSLSSLVVEGDAIEFIDKMTQKIRENINEES